MALCYPTQPFMLPHGTKYPSFQDALGNMMELYELSRNIPEDERPEYIRDLYNPLFYHQEILKRMLLMLDRILVMYGPGSGKTCASVMIGEHIRKHGTYVGKRPYPKRVYILEKGPSVIGDIKNQIAFVCAKDNYNIPESKTSKGKKRVLTVALESFYTIQTYGDFASVTYPDNIIESIYSDCIFIVDEAHNMNGVNEGNDDGSEESAKTMLEFYQYFKKITRIAKRTKIILMSATPMTNDASEISNLLNLLLPINKQIPKSINYNTISPEELKPYIDGITSYTPNIEPKVDVRDMGVQLPISLSNGDASSTYIVRIPMRGIQRRVYSSLGVPEVFFMNYRKVSGFVFPDGSFGGTEGKYNAGLYKYVSRPDTDTYIPLPDFVYAARNDLSSMSAKFDFVIRNELSPPSMLTSGGEVGDGPGASFFYFDFVTSQAIPFTMCLEAFDFERYNDGASAFVTTNGIRHINIPKKRRYIFVTKDNVATKLENFKELFNSDENKWGEYVQMIIGSAIIKDGINIFNVARIYINPSWNPTNMKQAIYRAIRVIGHDNIVRTLPNGQRFEVKIYRLSSVMDVESTRLNIHNSVEDYVYVNTIEEKNIGIDRIYKMLIEHSADRRINHRGPPVLQKDINYATYDEYNLRDYIMYTSKFIISMFSVENAPDIIHIDEVIRRVYEVSSPLLRKSEYIIRVLANIISNKTTITDKYGNSTWIMAKANKVFVSNTYPTGMFDGTIYDSYYRRTIISDRRTVKGFIECRAKERGDAIMDTVFEDNDTITRRLIAEKAVSLNGPTALLERLMKSVLYTMRKPFEELKLTSHALSLPSISKGVKASEDSKIKLKNVKYGNIRPDPDLLNVWIPDTSVSDPNVIVVVHNLGVLFDPCTYKTKKMYRIYDNGIWRNIRTFEESVYEHYMNKINEYKTSKLDEGKLYATLSFDGKLTINRVNKDMKDDKRMLTKGKECVNILKDELEELAKEEGLQLPKDISKTKLCNLMMSHFENANRLIVA